MPATLDLVLGLDVPPVVYPARMHGAACALFGHPEPGGRPRFSVWPLVDRGDRASWRVGWLAAEPCPRDVAAVTFGDDTHRVLDVAVREWTYPELAAARPARHADLDVHSPMFFSRNGRDLPLPDPVLIIQSLVGRWDHHAPPAFTVPDDVRRALLATVYLVGMDGGTVTGAVGTRTAQTGFVGSVSLALTRAADDPTASAFATLLRYAEIAGLGAQTGHGFGATTVRLGTDRSGKTPKQRGPRKPVPAAHRPSGGPGAAPEDPQVITGQAVLATAPVPAGSGPGWGATVASNSPTNRA